MKTISGLNYTLKIKELIKNTINEAQKNIFDNYYFIVDDPLFFEEAFFKYTDTLFNIRIITYNTLINNLLNHYQIYNQQKLSKLETILMIKQIIETNNYIFNTNNKMELIPEIINILELFYLEELDNPDIETLPDLSKQKITTIIDIYKQFKLATPKDKCFQYEDLLFNHFNDSLKDNHYCFITEKIFTKHRYKLINQLASISDVTILMNNSDDNRDLNKPFINYYDKDNDIIKDDDLYLNHLNTYTFSLQAPKFNEQNPLYKIAQTTPKAEIESVILNIYQDIVDNQTHYHDYAIYYPNHEYKMLLINTLEQFNIPHNLSKSLIFKEMNACLSFLKYKINKQKDDLLDLLDSRMLKKFNDLNYLDRIKKNYLENNVLDDPFSNYDFNQCVTLNDYVKIMLEFIDQEMITNENVITLINYFKEFQSTQEFSLSDFYILIKKTKPELKEDKKPCNDHLYLLNYDQCYSGILDCKKVYLTGVNETVVPLQFKDTGILLDQDLKSLKLPDLSYQIGSNQNNILKALNSNNNYLVISFANASIDGQPLLKSSLYNQLNNMFDIKNIDISKDYLHQSLKKNLYLKGQQDSKQTALNTMIDKYIQSRNQPGTLITPLFSNYLSASKLETYNGCPYKYYNQYGLKLYPFKKPSFQTNEIGSIVHYVLEKTKELFNQPVIDVDTLPDIIEKYVNEYIDNNELNDRLNDYNNIYIIKTVKQDLLNTIIVLNQQLQASDFEIVGSEIEIKRKYPDFNFTGIVDRVDQSDNYLKIIDYKSSNKDLDISLAIQGFNIQMLLYLDTLASKQQLDLGGLLYFNTKKRILASSLKITEEESSENFFKQYRMNGYVNEEVVTRVDNEFERNSNIIKARYVKKDDCYKGNILSSFALKRLIDYVTGHIEKLYDRLSHGNIQIAPKGSDDPAIFTKVNPCTYCNYRAICNFDVFYNEYTLVNNENLEDLIKEGENNAN